MTLLWYDYIFVLLLLYNSKGKQLMKPDLGYGKNFHLLTSEHLIKIESVLEKMIESVIFCRDPKRFPRSDWQKIEPSRARRYKREKN